MEWANQKSIQNPANTFRILAEIKTKIMAMESELLG